GSSRENRRRPPPRTPGLTVSSARVGRLMTPTRKAFPTGGRRGRTAPSGAFPEGFFMPPPEQSVPDRRDQPGGSQSILPRRGRLAEPRPSGSGSSPEPRPSGSGPDGVRAATVRERAHPPPDGRGSDPANPRSLTVAALIFIPAGVISLNDSSRRSVLFGLVDLHRKMVEMEALIAQDRHGNAN